MPKSEREASLQEAKLLSALHHPNIVTCYESFTERGRLCIVMDYCSGGDLYQRLKAQRGVPLAETQITAWFTQLLLGLKHVHDRKVLHRDLKTQNVFMTADGSCKLGDFGVSKVLTGTTSLASTAVGTPYYLSPEICENRAYNHKSDVWSLGCILYELCTLTHPFEGASLKLLILKILRGIYPPVPGRYGKPLRDTVAQMLQKDPQMRPSVNDLLARQPFKALAARLLDEEVHADEFSHTVIHRPAGAGVKPAAAARKAAGGFGGGRRFEKAGAVDLNEMKGKLSPPRDRPAPYPQGGEGIPSRGGPPAAAAPVMNPLPAAGGMIRRAPAGGERRAAAAVGGAGGAGAPPHPHLHPRHPPVTPPSGPGPATLHAAAVEEAKQRRAAAAHQEQRRRAEEQMEQRRAAEARRAAARAEAERRRVEEREAARRDFRLRRMEARANRAQVEGGDDVEVFVGRAPPRAPSVLTPPGPHLAGRAARPEWSPVALPAIHPAAGGGGVNGGVVPPDASFPPVGGAGGARADPSEEERRRVFMENRAAAERNRRRAALEANGGEGEKGEKKDFPACPALDHRRDRDDDALFRGRPAPDGDPSGRRDAAAAEEERRRVFWEGREAAARNRRRALDDGYDGEDGVVVGVNEGGARLLIDPGTGVVLGASTAPPTELIAAALSAAHTAELTCQDDAGHASRFAAVTAAPANHVTAVTASREDGTDAAEAGTGGGEGEAAGEGQAATSSADQAHGDAGDEMVEDGEEEEPGAPAMGAADKKVTGDDDGKEDAADAGGVVRDPSPVEAADATWEESVPPSKFLLDGKTVVLPNVDEGATLPTRVEALRVYLEGVLGESKFIRAYKAMDELSEQDDEEAVVGKLCEVMGDDIAYLGLIHQLLVCEDSLHAANSTVNTTVGVAALTVEA